MSHWDVIGAKIYLMAMKTSWLEWIAVFTSVVYVLLASYQKRACWLFAVISSGIYCMISYNAQLYVDVVLNFIYIVLAIMGWLSWDSDNAIAAQNDVPVIRWSIKFHLVVIGSALVLGVVTGWLLANFTNQAFPYLDAFVFYFSVGATYMISKKVLENWIYFVVIDAAMVYIYQSRGYFLSSLLYGAFTILAVFGFIQWRRAMHRQKVSRSKPLE